MSELFRAIGIEDDAGVTALRAFADPVSPDIAARSQQVGQQLGLPAPVVRTDLAVFQTEAERRMAERMLKGKPRLIDWLDDPENAAVAKDDLEPLGFLEGLGNAVQRGGTRLRGSTFMSTGAAEQRTASDFGKSVEDIARELAPNFDNLGPSGQYEVMQRARRRVQTAEMFGGEFAGQTRQRAAETLAEGRSIMDRAAEIEMSDAGARFRETLFAADNALGPIFSAFASDPAGALAFVTETAAEFVPVLAGATAASVIGGPAAGIGVMAGGSFTMEQGSEIADFLAEKGVDLSTPEAALAALDNEELFAEARERGLTRGLIIAGFDALSGGVAGRALSSSPAGDVALQALAQMAAGGGGEAAAQLATDGEIDLREVVVEALAELVTTPVEVFGVGARTFGKQATRAAQSGTTATTLQELDQAVAGSKLRERAPERFRSFLETTDLSRVSLSVPAEDLRTYYQAKDTAIDFDGLGIDEEAFADALLTGGDVSIRATVYAERISGTEDAAWFHQNATLSPDEMSVSEAQRFNEEATAILMEEAEKAEAGFRAEMESRASDVQVRDAIFSQLREAGHSPDVAEREASVWGAFFRTMGERYGEDALDLARQFGVRIEGPQQQRQTRIRDNLDVALNTLRKGLPKEGKPQSLVQWIISRGGISGIGNEFADAPEGLARPDGPRDMFGGGVSSSVDDVALAAIEAGFFPELQSAEGQLGEGAENAVDVLMAAIDRELRGEPVTRLDDAPDASLEELRALEAELTRRGISLEQSNDEIAEAMGLARTGTLNQGAVATVAQRYGLTPDEVQSIVETPMQELRDRDRYLPPSNTDEPTTDFPRLPVGSAKIGLYGDPAQAYVEVLREFAPNDLTSTEAEDGIKRSKNYQKYVQWFREGKEAPPVFVAESDKGDGKLLTTNRRRTLAAQEAGVPSIAGWFSPHNPETGLPLKYGDIMRAVEEGQTLFQPAPPVESDAFKRWFGDSKVVDENGKPLVVYHGTATDVEEFRGRTSRAIWFADDPGYAGKYATSREGSPVIYPVYLSVQNPLVIDMQGREELPKGLEGVLRYANRIEDVVGVAKSQGHDGVIFKNRKRTVEDFSADEYVAFRPEQIKSVHNRGTFDPADPRVLYQPNRASITFPAEGIANGETVIRLFETADLSSFLHESGHFFLEAFTALANRPDANEGTAADLDTIRKFLGNEGEAWTVDQQEKWARGFEAYLMEGRAPSLELADAFSRFKAWLVRIYRSVRNLNVRLTPEIREVMDRMLATEAEIAAARDQAAMDPLFAQAPPGMTEAEFRTYQRLARRATEQAEQALLEKTMAKVRREREAWFKDERKAVRAEVEAEFNRRREYRLIEMLANQRWLGEEVSDIPDMQIDRDELVSRFGAGVIAEIDRTRLGGKRAIYAKGGTSPDVVADLFGFRDADEMVRVLQNTRKRREAIAAEVDRRLTERHGDPLSDGSIEEEALAAIHSDSQAKTVAAEARQLARQTGKDARNITARIFRQRARAMLGRMRVGDVRSARFLQAERQAARSAQSEFAKVAGGQGREALAAAQRFKEAQLLNHYLYVEARELETEVKRGRERMRRYENRKVREKLAGGYIEQIDAILDGYEFRLRSRRQVERMESLRDFVARMTAEGRAHELSIDDRLMEDANRKHYTRLTVDEIRGLFDTVENIDHMGRFKQKLIDAKEQRDLDAVVTEIRQAFADNVDGTPPGRIETRGERNRKRFRDYLNLTLNADTLLREIDGFADLGPAWRHLKRSIDDGAARVAERREKMAADFEGLYSVYSRKEQRDMSRKGRIDGVATSLSKWDVIAIALNTGNEQNYDRLVNGGKHAISAPQVDAALATLDERDWRFVQSVWDYLESYWPEIEAKEKRLTGTAPKKVAAKPMVPAHPFVKGGYYPIRYDSRLSGTVGDFEAKELAETMMAGAFGKAQTRNGHTKARAEHVARPLQLNLSVVHQHVDQVIRDLELGEPLANAWRILQHRGIKEVFLETGKRSDFEALELWLLDTASGDMVSARGLEVFLRHVRSGFTISRLALNISTALIQPSGIMQSAVQIGKKPMARGMIEFMRHPQRWVSDVMAVSSLMRERQRTFQRDVLHTINAANEDGPATSRFQQFQREVVLPLSFVLMQKVQFYSVDMPTWVAAYLKEMDRSGNEADARTFADSMVRRAQGSGLMSDRGMLERGTTAKESRQRELPRMFTALGSYMFAKFNVAYERTGRTNFRSPTEVLSYATDMALLFALEAALYALVKGGLPDDDDDEDMLLWLARETALSAMATLPYLREVSGALQGFNSGGIFGSGVETLTRPLLQAAQGEADKALVKALVNGVGVMLHLPASQTNTLIDAIFDEDMRARSDTAPIEYFIKQRD